MWDWTSWLGASWAEDMDEKRRGGELERYLENAELDRNGTNGDLEL